MPIQIPPPLMNRLKHYITHHEIVNSQVVPYQRLLALIEVQMSLAESISDNIINTCDSATLQVFMETGVFFRGYIFKLDEYHVLTVLKVPIAITDDAETLK